MSKRPGVQRANGEITITAKVPSKFDPLRLVAKYQINFDPASLGSILSPEFVEKKRMERVSHLTRSIGAVI